MDTGFKERLLALHRVDWLGVRIWLAFVFAFLALEGLLLLLLLDGPETAWQIAAAVVLVLLIGHVMHAQLIALHESSHGLLCPVTYVNDAIGLIIGQLSFLSPSLYRAAHHTHHAFLATERDEELWPFVQPGTPRWVRLLAAQLELICGLLYTPLLFLRAFLRPGTVIQNPGLRRRIWLELAVLVVHWVVVLAAVAWLDLWQFLLIMYVAPAWLAGNLQSLRKYIEHMGVTGSTALSATRSVLPVGWAGRLVSMTLWNEPFHGIHHKYPRLPQDALPELPAVLTPSQAGEIPPFASYRQALWDMLPSLADPRVGQQWQGVHGP
jgi:fatty acid desaturase